MFHRFAGPRARKIVVPSHYDPGSTLAYIVPFDRAIPHAPVKFVPPGRI